MPAPPAAGGDSKVRRHERWRHGAGSSSQFLGSGTTLIAALLLTVISTALNALIASLGEIGIGRSGHGACDSWNLASAMLRRI